MQRSRKLAALLLAAFWAVMGFHCLLEVLPGFELLRCEQTHSETTDPGCHCEDAACHTVEAGLYLTANAQPSPTSSQLFLSNALNQIVEPDPPPPPEITGRSSIPPDLQTIWQFTLRAALPVRAPSLLS